MDETLKELALWAKKKEIYALERSQILKADPQGYGTFQGKAQAYSEIWEKIVFDGRSVPDGSLSPMEYNKENEHWSEMAMKDEPKNDAPST